ncbi:MAG TPA: 2-oxoacid:acceptor oxidoreductase subunit alpha [Caldisericia bacterium]|jgi:2-oxoglutarate ferredoxin oxidoreductase subunit alpha|nr:2-oxoacid:acceptor oxidoreductase subunit alpha [Caldisericia bacterium]HXK50967.1 2-oxoacid:acceptor oxidoreductase subunit alpha [Caldisericia bacterium]
MSKQTEILQGAEACVRGALKAGIGFFAGYPITPSTEIAELFSTVLAREEEIFIQMEDEIASITAIIGASLAGKKSMTATSGPGFSLMQEGLGYAAMVEVPLVIVNVQRGGPSTGLPTKVAQGDVMQSRWGSHGDHPMIVLSPSSVQELYEMTIQAFNLSEKYRTPVVILTTETIVHMREKVEIDPQDNIRIINRLLPDLKPGDSYLSYGKFVDDVPVIGNIGDGLGTSVTGLIHMENGFQSADYEVADRLIRRIHRKIEKHTSELFEVEIINPNAEIMFISYGVASRTVKSLLYTDHPGIGLIRPKTLFPIDPIKIQDATKNAKKIIVSELNLGQYVYEMQRILPNKKVHLMEKIGGELIPPKEMLRRIEDIHD